MHGPWPMPALIAACPFPAAEDNGARQRHRSGWRGGGGGGCAGFGGQAAMKADGPAGTTAQRWAG